MNGAPAVFGTFKILQSRSKSFIKEQIASRRTRLGAKLGQVTGDVKREVFNSSQLSHWYRQVINWTSSDDVRGEYEEKLLSREYDMLIYSTTDGKSQKLDVVLTLAEGMVIINHAFQLAWDLVLESRDVEDFRQLGRLIHGARLTRQPALPLPLPLTCTGALIDGSSPSWRPPLLLAPIVMTSSHCRV